MAGVGLSLATSGHAATAPPQWLTGPAVFVHGVAVAFWVGALAPLLAMARKQNGELLPVLLQFSHVAVPLVGAAGADRHRARDRPARKLSRADRDLVRHHPAGQAGAGRDPARLAALNRLCLTPEMHADRSEHADLCWVSVLLECCWRARHSRRRRRLAFHDAAARAAPLRRRRPRRSRSISTPRPRCSRC